MATHEQPNWLGLPTDLVELIARKCRDAVTGLVAFRSVCRTWRAAVGPAPRLLVPAPPRARSDDSEHALVIALSSGWSIIVDARDTSCRLSHLATGATAALPKLVAVYEGRDIAHRKYSHYTDDEGARWGPGEKIWTELRPHRWFFTRYIDFADRLRFAVHVPPAGTAAAAAVIIMMYHPLQGRMGMVFCRPGDAAWTMVEKPAGAVVNHNHGYFDFAYHGGKMYGLQTNGVTEVFDATTLEFVHRLKRPPDTPNLANKMHGTLTDNDEFDYVHLVALPAKLVLVRTTVKSSQPVAFTIFEIGSAPDADADGLAWLKVADAGNYELFLDGYKATFMENKDKDGTRIYYIHDKCSVAATTQAYCYSMQDNKFECLYTSPDNSHECSTKPSWFVP